MGESVYGLIVHDVLLEASLRLGGEKSFNLGDGSPTSNGRESLLASVTILHPSLRLRQYSG